MPSSYQAPSRGDAKRKDSVSQSTQTNMPAHEAVVGDIIGAKGGAVFAIQPEETIETAVKMLSEKRIGALVVTDADGALKGILSERDIVRKLAETPGQTLPQKVSDIMTSSVVVCAPEEPLVNVLRKMTDGRFRHMPVLDGDTLAGMLTIGDVVNFRLVQLEHESLQLKQMIVG